MTPSKSTSLQVTYCTDEHLPSVLFQSRETLMGVVGFARRPLPLPVVPGPIIQVPLEPLDNAPLFELWTADEPLRYTREGPLQCAYGSTLLFGCLTPDPTSDEDLALSTEKAYGHVFKQIDQSGYGHLLRIWHYFPRITEGQPGSERYRDFNSGRYRAFSAYRKDVRAAPAASALGTSDGPLVIYFLASTSPGLPLENQRQVSAYNYPKRYGPFSPIFSRAMHGGGQLFISGTASIVGHTSMYDGSVIEQTHETIANVKAVLSNATSGTLPSGGLQLKAYLRYPEHLAFVRNALANAFGEKTPIAFFQAQICRRELLLEIEGTWRTQQ